MMDKMFWIGRIVLRLAWRIGVPSLVILWRLPWTVITTAPRFVASIRWMCGYPARLLAATSDSARCPRCGREQSLLGRWVCPVCRGVEVTHAFASCRICGTECPAGYIQCEDPECRTAIVNPVLGGPA